MGSFLCCAGPAVDGRRVPRAPALSTNLVSSIPLCVQRDVIATPESCILKVRPSQTTWLLLTSTMVLLCSPPSAAAVDLSVLNLGLADGLDGDGLDGVGIQDDDACWCEWSSESIFGTAESCALLGSDESGKDSFFTVCITLCLRIEA